MEKIIPAYHQHARTVIVIMLACSCLHLASRTAVLTVRPASQIDEHGCGLCLVGLKSDQLFFGNKPQQQCHLYNLRHCRTVNTKVCPLVERKIIKVDKLCVTIIQH